MAVYHQIKLEIRIKTNSAWKLFFFSNNNFFPFYILLKLKSEQGQNCRTGEKYEYNHNIGKLGEK